MVQKINVEKVNERNALYRTRTRDWTYAPRDVCMRRRACSYICIHWLTCGFVMWGQVDRLTANFIGQLMQIQWKNRRISETKIANEENYAIGEINQWRWNLRSAKGELWILSRGASCIKHEAPWASIAMSGLMQSCFYSSIDLNIWRNCYKTSSMDRTTSQHLWWFYITIFYLFNSELSLKVRLN